MGRFTVWFSWGNNEHIIQQWDGRKVCIFLLSLMVAFIWLIFSTENNCKIRGKEGIQRQSVLKPHYQKERKQTEVIQFSTAYFLPGFNWFNSQGIETTQKSVTWTLQVSPGTVETVVVQGHQSVQKWRDRVYSKEAFEKKISEHCGWFSPMMHLTNFNTYRNKRISFPP